MENIAVQYRGGSTTEHNIFVGLEREVTVDTTKKTLVVHDGVTTGGIPLAKASEITTINTVLENKQDTHASLTTLTTIDDTVTGLVKFTNGTASIDSNVYVTTSGVTSVTGSSPIVSSGGDTPDLSILPATTLNDGSMSAADKNKLDNIEDNANNYSHPVSGIVAGNYSKVEVDINGHVIGGNSETISTSAPSGGVNGDIWYQY